MIPSIILTEYVFLSANTGTYGVSHWVHTERVCQTGNWMSVVYRRHDGSTGGIWVSDSETAVNIQSLIGDPPRSLARCCRLAPLVKLYSPYVTFPQTVWRIIICQLHLNWGELSHNITQVNEHAFMLRNIPILTRLGAYSKSAIAMQTAVYPTLIKIWAIRINKSCIKTWSMPILLGLLETCKDLHRNKYSYWSSCSCFSAITTVCNTSYGLQLGN